MDVEIFAADDSLPEVHRTARDMRRRAEELGRKAREQAKRAAELRERAKRLQAGAAQQAGWGGMPVVGRAERGGGIPPGT